MSKSTVKKILSLILSVVMLLLLMPLSPKAAADETSALPSDPVETPESLLDENCQILNYIC